MNHNSKVNKGGEMLSKVTDYSIYKESSTNQLNDRVKQAMNDGWVPSGPLVLDGSQYMQVMIKFGK